MSDGVLKNWQIVFGDKLLADIYGDTKGRFQDGSRIMTSKIKSIDFTNNSVETKNSKYTLGEKYSNIYEDIRALKLLRALKDVEEYCSECVDSDKKAILKFIEWKYRNKDE